MRFRITYKDNVKFILKAHHLLINHIVKHPDTLTPLITGVEPAKSHTFNTLITRCFTIWWAERDSNPQSTTYEVAALTVMLSAQIIPYQFVHCQEA